MPARIITVVGLIASLSSGLERGAPLHTPASDTGPQVVTVVAAD